LVQDVHRLALAGAVHAVDEDDDREALVLEQAVLSLEEVRSQLRDLLLVPSLVDRVPQLGGLEHPSSLSQRHCTGSGWSEKHAQAWLSMIPAPIARQVIFSHCPRFRMTSL